MTWAELDWHTLDRLRDRFLQGGSATPYWETADDLANYDLTFGERIGWKWDHVLRELRLRGWTPVHVVGAALAAVPSPDQGGEGMPTSGSPTKTASRS